MEKKKTCVHFFPFIFFLVLTVLSSLLLVVKLLYKMLECYPFVHVLHPVGSVNDVRFSHLLFLRFIDSFFFFLSSSFNAHFSQRKELVLHFHSEISSNMKKIEKTVHYYQTIGWFDFAYQIIIIAKCTLIEFL